ncbi:MAG: sugar ABC transporter ATP-binding protein [Pseudothermotoga sp.]
MSENNVILQARNITKVFPGVIAVNDVSLSIEKGIVTAVVGENGAGKSTLMKIFAGVYSDYAGKIFIEGKETRFKTPREAIDCGIFLIPQELDLVPNLTIAENMWMGREPLNLWGFVDYKKLFKESKEVLGRVRLNVDPRKRVEELSTGQQQLVAIAKSLVSKAKIIIMDEPTSAISEKEIENLFEIIRNLQSQGASIIYISHKLDEVFSIAQRIAVMRDGKLVAEGRTEQFTYDDVVRLMVGRTIDKFFVRERSKIGDEVLRVENLSAVNERNKTVVDNVSFSVRKGEILGIYGLIGAGRTETMEALFGFYPHTRVTAEIFVDGKPVLIRKTLDAIKSGLGYVPEDRKLSGLILQMTVLHNISLPGLRHLSKLGFINRVVEKSTATDFVKRLNIKTPSVNQIVENLSGGNQQKVVLAKWLSLRPKVILLDEPTRGIDVNAKAEIYSLINDLAKSGVGVILVSSELPEVMAMSDRIIVMSEGRKTAEFSREEATEEKLLKAAIPKSFRTAKTTVEGVNNR